MTVFWVTISYIFISNTSKKGNLPKRLRTTVIRFLIVMDCTHPFNNLPIPVKVYFINTLGSQTSERDRGKPTFLVYFWDISYKTINYNWANIQKVSIKWTFWKNSQTLPWFRQKLQDRNYQFFCASFFVNMDGWPTNRNPDTQTFATQLITIEA